MNRVEKIVARLEKSSPEGAAICRRAWASNQHKHNELCTILQPSGYGYVAAHDGKHRGPDFVMAELAKAAAGGYNILLNIGPRPDGSVPEEDVRTLREVGRRIRADGWPEAETAREG